MLSALDSPGELDRVRDPYPIFAPASFIKPVVNGLPFMGDSMLV